jgi:alpha-tubulin suppressor-like RCC1 family protein
MRRLVAITVGLVLTLIVGTSPVLASGDRVGASGRVWAWGNVPGFPQKSVPVRVPGLRSVVALAAGADHLLVLRADGMVWGFGANESGQLGSGTTESGPTPVRAVGLTRVVAVDAGEHHSLAIRADGTLWAWGANDVGQLGTGDTRPRLVPTRVASLTRVISAAVGKDDLNGAWSMALRADGTVWTWGAGNVGQLGTGASGPVLLPRKVSRLAAIRTIAAAGETAYALRADGRVMSWGYNYDGETGTGLPDGVVRTPAVVVGLRNVVELSGKCCHTLALRGDGAVFAWGYNADGAVGDGTRELRTTPVRVHHLGGATDVAGGVFFSVARLADGRARSWGSDLFQQLGNGAAGSRLKPGPVVNLPPVRAISAGFGWAVALT